MAFQQISGSGLWTPDHRLITPPPGFSSTSPIDATGDRYAVSGPVWFKERTGTKAITRVGFRFGTVVKAGGSALTVSLQDPSLTAGPPKQPDGVQDQTVAIANADAAFVSNTWIRTGALSANRTVSFGEQLSVVVEYDGAGRLATDSVIFSGIGIGSASQSLHHTTAATNSAGWTVSTGIPLIVLEFSDGTFGTLEGCFPAEGTNAHTFNSGDGADEYAMELTVPYACKIDAIRALVFPFSGADFELVLYKGTTALKTIAIDQNQVGAASVKWMAGTFAEQELTPGTTYRVAVKPVTGNDVVAYSFDVFAAGHLQAHDAGVSFNYTTRSDAGAWAAATATRRLFAGIRISSLSDNVGGGSNGPGSYVFG